MRGVGVAGVGRCCMLAMPIMRARGRFNDVDLGTRVVQVQGVRDIGKRRDSHERCETQLAHVSSHERRRSSRASARGALSSVALRASPVMNRCQLMSLSCDMLIFSTQGLELA
eukprot:scaffold11799_cov63-Phaeocystis_antarctica.AAC.2